MRAVFEEMIVAFNVCDDEWRSVSSRLHLLLCARLLFGLSVIVVLFADFLNFHAVHLATAPTAPSSPMRIPLSVSFRIAALRLPGSPAA